MRRAAALFLLLFAVYAATLGLDAFGDSDYGGDEPHYLLAAESLVEDGDVDVKDEYAARAYADFYPYDLDKHGKETDGRLHEPHGVGFPLLIAPAYAIGGAEGVELFLAAIAALAVALALPAGAAGGARPVGARRRAGGGAVAPVRGLRHRRLPRADRRAPLLAGAALLAARLEEQRVAARRVRLLRPARAAALAGHEVRARRDRDRARSPIRSLMRARRGTLALGSAELALFSVALYVGINEALYGGPTPYAADVAGETATDAALPARLPGAHLPAGGAVHRPRLRPAALGAGVPARVRRAVAALPRRAATGCRTPCPSCARSSAPR